MSMRILSSHKLIRANGRPRKYCIIKIVHADNTNVKVTRSVSVPSQPESSDSSRTESCSWEAGDAKATHSLSGIRTRGKSVIAGERYVWCRELFTSGGNDVHRTE